MIAFDETWSDEGGSGMPVRVPGPGTYTVTVEAPYCGADGLVVDNEVSTTVTVPGRRRRRRILIGHDKGKEPSLPATINV